MAPRCGYLIIWAAVPPAVADPEVETDVIMVLHHKRTDETSLDEYERVGILMTVMPSPIVLYQESAFCSASTIKSADDN